jgi:hypothetical protein
LKFTSCRDQKKTKNQACDGLEVRGANVQRAAVTAGTFVLTLVRPASTVSITAVTPFLHAKTSLLRNLGKRKAKTITFTVLIIDTNGAPMTIPLRLKVK